MKKIILTATMAICTIGLFAQSAAPAPLTSKRGEMILPEAGDWAISFDASPFLTYLGSFFTSSSGLNPAPTANFLGSNQTIIGKYFVDEKTAYRGILRIGFSSNSLTEQTLQDPNGAPATNPPPAMVSDKLSVSSHFIGLGAGMEKRKGHTRLQGYYGAELMFWLSSTGNDSTMTYGNAYNSSTNPTPTFYNFGSGTANQSMSAGYRVISDKPGSTFGISALAFIGFEYFFMPKISVGAEYTWGITFWSQGQGTLELEQVYTDVSSGKPADGTFSYKTSNTSHFGVDTGVNSIFGNSSNAGKADLNIIFHF